MSLGILETEFCYVALYVVPMYVTQPSLKLKAVFLPQPHKSWPYRLVSHTWFIDDFKLSNPPYPLGEGKHWYAIVSCGTTSEYRTANNDRQEL